MREDRPRRLPEGAQDAQRGRTSHASEALAAHAAACRRAPSDSRPRHEAVLHARRACPSSAPSSRARRVPSRSRGPGMTWPPGAGRHDEDGAAHARPPRMSVAILPVDAQQDRQRDAVRRRCPMPPKLISGSVSPLVGSTPMFTPMLMNAWHADPDADALRARAPAKYALERRPPGGRSRTRAAPARRTARSRTATPDEAELLADHGQQEIGVRLGQVEAASRRSRRDPRRTISPRPKAISECDSW